MCYPSSLSQNIVVEENKLNCNATNSSYLHYSSLLHNGPRWLRSFPPLSPYLTRSHSHSHHTHAHPHGPFPTDDLQRRSKSSRSSYQFQSWRRKGTLLLRSRYRGEQKRPLCLNDNICWYFKNFSKKKNLTSEFFGGVSRLFGFWSAARIKRIFLLIVGGGFDGED
jgi:hypothetical protein